MKAEKGNEYAIYRGKKVSSAIKDDSTSPTHEGLLLKGQHWALAVSVVVMDIKK